MKNKEEQKKKKLFDVLNYLERVAAFTENGSR
jgi:hypothetical protein